MSTILLDAGVWLAARDRRDSNHESSAELLRRGAGGELTLSALDLTLYETANVAAVKWGSRAEVDRLYELIVALAGRRLVRVDRELLAAAAALATTRRLTAYDGAYVACARLNRWRLVSTDLADLVNPGLAEPPEAALGDR